MKRVIAIAFSDLHINDWSKFNQDNERTLNHFRVLSDIVDLCYEYNCPALFCGDLFHKPEMMSQELYSILVSNLNSTISQKAQILVKPLLIRVEFVYMVFLTLIITQTQISIQLRLQKPRILKNIKTYSYFIQITLGLRILITQKLVHPKILI